MSNTTLKSTFADVRKLDAKVVNAKNIKLNGQNVEQLWGLNLPKDYPKLVHGVKLPQDADYILCDSLGVPVYMTFNEKLVDGSYLFSSYPNTKQITFDFPNLTNGSYMFANCSKLISVGDNSFNKVINGDHMFFNCSSLTSFSGDLSSLTNGNSMFANCSNLTSFSGDLSSLTDGNSMFSGIKITSFLSPLPSLSNGTNIFTDSRLDADSVQNILSTIPTHSDGATHSLTLILQESGATKFKQITGFTVPVGTVLGRTQYKGWSIRVVSKPL